MAVADCCQLKATAHCTLCVHENDQAAAGHHCKWSGAHFPVTGVPAGELFDFDTEVEPLLEVLVGKVLEQAL